LKRKLESASVPKIQIERHDLHRPSWCCHRP
jgi:hypothetical protein